VTNWVTTTASKDAPPRTFADTDHALTRVVALVNAPYVCFGTKRSAAYE